MAKDDVQVINHHQANLQVKERTAKSGKITKSTFITTTVESEPIAVMLEEGAVARRAAEMFAERIREQTKQIAEQVKPATAAARRKLEKAYAAGKPDAVRRFSGGRTGATPPKVTNQAFNHSGRLANGIVATFRKTEKDWAINYPANRWNPKDWPSIGAMEVAFRRWVAHVPVLQGRASHDPAIRKEIEKTFEDVLQKQRMGADHKQALAVGKAVVQALQLLARVA